MSCEPPLPREFRQAVVVIHGIGQQEPMDTLRAFVGELYGKDYEVCGKPDRISDSLELYRLSAQKQKGIPRTDFYEFYWAYLMEGTTWDHVGAWARMLLCRKHKFVPARLRPFWWSLWLLIVGAAVVAMFTLPWNTPAAVGAGVLGVLSFVLLKIARAALGTFGLHYVGDAARYLSPTPANIRVRHAIRTEILKLLRGLHKNDYHPTQHYDRIVVVGHSLGSVIAYDALRYYWQEVHSYPLKMLLTDDNDRPILPSHTDRQQPVLAEMQQAIKHRDTKEAEFLQLQQDLWKEQRRLGIAWKITDLVTLGSPLTYADFLMATDHEDLKRRHDDREFPTCPPMPDDHRDAGLLAKHVTIGNEDATLCVLHHAAPFACTRWTNLYYSSDLIGGAVKSQFRKFIQDRELKSPTRWPGSHVRYWHKTNTHALSHLRAALRLEDAEAFAPHLHTDVGAG